jgi:para-nitrobenzyl esterase
MMSESWIAFARSGAPSNPTIPEWPAYSTAQRNMMVFRTQPGVEVDIRAAERATLGPSG